MFAPLSLESPGATAPISLSPPQFVFPRSSLRRLRVGEVSLFVGQMFFLFFVFFFLTQLHELSPDIEMELVETSPVGSRSERKSD